MSLVEYKLDRATPRTDQRSVALVHDYLNQRGGAERVVLSMAAIWPDAPIYTSLYRPGVDLRRLPGPRGAHLLDGQAARSTSPSARCCRSTRPRCATSARSTEDVVISSSSGWAHAVRTAPESVHIVYCHTPARWLYRGEEYFTRRGAAPDGPVARCGAGTGAPRTGRTATSPTPRTSRGASAPSTASTAAVVNPPVDTRRFRPMPARRAAARRLPPAALQARRPRRRRRTRARHRPRRRRRRARARAPAGDGRPRHRLPRPCRRPDRRRADGELPRVLLPGARGLRHRAGGGQRRRQARRGVRGRRCAGVDGRGRHRDASSAARTSTRSSRPSAPSTSWTRHPEMLAANAGRFSEAAFEQRLRHVVETTYRR